MTTDDDELPDFSNDPVVTEYRNWGDYLAAWCPLDGCGAKNWVYLGRMDDITAPDREVMKCYACGKHSWLGTEIRDEAQYGASETSKMEDFFVENGEKDPPTL